MLTPSAEYLAENAKLGRTPVYAIIITLHTSPVTYARYSTAPLTDNSVSPPVAFLPYMELPKGTETSIQDEQEIIGSLSLTINDDQSESVTELIASGIGGCSVAFKGGFDNIAYDKFADLPGGIIANYKLNQSLTAYILDVKDPQSLANVQIGTASATVLTAIFPDSPSSTYAVEVVLTGGSVVVHGVIRQSVASYSTALDAIYGAGNWSYSYTTAVDGTVIHVADTSLFESSGIVIIDSEAIAYSGKTSTTFTGLTRGYLSTNAAIHEQDFSPVAEIVRWGPGLPMDIIQEILTATGKRGCGISPALIDSAAFDAAQVVLGTAEMEIRILSPVNARDLILKELFKISGALMVTRDGLISVVLVAQPTDTVASLTDSSCFNHQWDGNFPSLVNRYFIRYDANPLLKVFGTTFDSAVDAVTEPFGSDSIDKYSEESIAIDSLALRSEQAGTTEFIEARVTAWLQRYAYTAPLVTLSAHLQKGLMQCGDLIELTAAQLPDMFRQARGIVSAIFQVIKATPNYAQGYIVFGLLWTQFNAITVDDFNRADTVWDTQPDLDGDWSSTSACLDGIEVHSGALRMGNFGAGTGGYGTLFRGDSATTWADDQESELTFVSQGASGLGGPAIRQDPGSGYGSYAGYAAVFLVGFNQIELRKYNYVALNGGAYTLLAGPYFVALTAGDKLRILAHGSTISVNLNGAEILSAVDATFGSGSPGAMMAKATGSITWGPWRGNITRL